MMKHLSAMTASSSMQTFCQWLLSDANGKLPPSAIVLQGDPSFVNDRLVGEISQYLNEYDDDADGPWLNASSELIQRIAADPSSRRLLGMADLTSPDEAKSPAEYLRTLNALTKRGHLVFRDPGEADHTIEHPRVFRAGVGGREQVKGRCHIIIDPSMMSAECVPQVIADVFLEWVHCDERHERPAAGA